MSRNCGKNRCISSGPKSRVLGQSGYRLVLWTYGWTQIHRLTFIEPHYIEMRSACHSQAETRFYVISSTLRNCCFFSTYLKWLCHNFERFTVLILRDRQATNDTNFKENVRMIKSGVVEGSAWFREAPEVIEALVVRDPRRITSIGWNFKPKLCTWWKWLLCLSITSHIYEDPFIQTRIWF